MRLREHNIILHGSKVALRPMTEYDWDILARWNSDTDVLWFSEGDYVQSYSLEDIQEIYRETSQTSFCFIIEVNKRPIGECWLQKMNIHRILTRYPDKDCRRIDLMIGEKSLWGFGYGTDTIGTLTRFGFEEEEGADMIFGIVYDYNPRSRRTFEKNGYVEDQRIKQPTGGKARWEYNMLIRREDYLMSIDKLK